MDKNNKSSIAFANIVRYSAIFHAAGLLMAFLHWPNARTIDLAPVVFLSIISTYIAAVTAYDLIAFVNYKIGMSSFLQDYHFKVGTEVGPDRVLSRPEKYVFALPFICCVIYTAMFLALNNLPR